MFIKLNTEDDVVEEPQHTADTPELAVRVQQGVRLARYGVEVLLIRPEGQGRPQKGSHGMRRSVGILEACVRGQNIALHKGPDGTIVIGRKMGTIGAEHRCTEGRDGHLLHCLSGVLTRNAAQHRESRCQGICPVIQNTVCTAVHAVMLRTAQPEAFVDRLCQSGSLAAVTLGQLIATPGLGRTLGSRSRSGLFAQHGGQDATANAVHHVGTEGV